MALLGGQFKSATHGQFKSAQGGQFDRILHLRFKTCLFDVQFWQLAPFKIKFNQCN